MLPPKIARAEAIRRAYASPKGYLGLKAIHVGDVYTFASRLVEQGVTRDTRRDESTWPATSPCAPAARDWAIC
jgi:hypothetical protein